MVDWLCEIVREVEKTLSNTGQLSFPTIGTIVYANNSDLICIKSKALKAQVHVSKIILNSLNLIFKIYIVANQGQIHREDS